MRDFVSNFSVLSVRLLKPTAAMESCIRCRHRHLNLPEVVDSYRITRFPGRSVCIIHLVLVGHVYRMSHELTGGIRCSSQGD